MVFPITTLLLCSHKLFLAPHIRGNVFRTKMDEISRASHIPEISYHMFGSRNS